MNKKNMKFCLRTIIIVTLPVHILNEKETYDFFTYFL